MSKSFIKISKNNIEEIEDHNVWIVIDAFFKEHGFVSHHLDSYNSFIENDIHRIVEGKIITVEKDEKVCTVEFVDVFLDSPKHRKLNEEIIDIYPKQCIDGDISYLSNLYCNLEFTNQNNSKKIYENVHIGAIPAMVKSMFCNLYDISDDKEKLAKLEENFYDPGGYFIINGARKVLCNEERTIFNKTCVYNNRKTSPKYDIYAEVRSITINGNHNTTSCIGMFHKHKTIEIVIPYIETSGIPLCVIFKALGASSEDEIVKYVFGNKRDEEGLKILRPSLEFSYECHSTEAALHYIGRSGKKFTGGNRKDESDELSDELSDEEDDRLKKEDEKLKKNIQIKMDAVSYAKHLIEAEFLPHIGTDEKTNKEKMFYLGNMVKKLIDVKLKRRELDDRDHESVKRRLTAGIRLGNLFNNAFKRLCSEISISIEKCLSGKHAVDIKSIIKPNTIKSAMCNAISNNNWGGRGKTPGISQEYDCFNYQSLLSNARKDRAPITAEGGKVEKPRQVHGTHWGNECMSDTPEGKQAGLVKNKAMCQLITNGSDHFSILEIIKNMNIIQFDSIDNIKEFFDITKIFLNGFPVGVTRYPENIRNELLNLRRSGSINLEISISYNKKLEELYIMTDAGRTIRPLFIVENGAMLLKKHHIEEIKKGYWDEPPGNTWTKLLTEGFIELVDKQEEEYTLIAMFPSEIENNPNRYKLTHCELNPCMAFGVGVNIIPFPDHNQCIFEDELVYMANGTTKKIKDVLVGDLVINFDPKTQTQLYTLVVSNHTGPTNKKIYEITTHSNRKIKATYDHRFMTNKGWMRLEHIDVCTLHQPPQNPTLIAVTADTDVILENIPKKISIPIPIGELRKVFLKLRYFDEYILNSFGNELNFDDAYLLTRARIIGYSLSGRVKILVEDENVVFYAKFKNMCDAIIFNEDLKNLGYYSSNIFETSNKEISLKNKDCSLIVFLLSCGVEVLGIKYSLNVPEFVRDGCRSVKKEFLAGFQGGTINQIKYDIPEHSEYSEHINFIIPSTIILSSEDHIRCNKQFRDDIVNMMEDFGVYSRVYTNTSNSLYSLEYHIECDYHNLINYAKKIGYRYNRPNILEMGLISEYLISIEMGTFKESYAKWREFVDFSQDGYTLFVPVYKKEAYDKNVNISDITTLSSNQSFICGDGFCVHNSPRNTYQCIYKEEYVLMEDDSLKQIKDVHISDRVKIFNPETKEISSTGVIYTQMYHTQKPIMKFKTYHSEIILTHDHKIFTPIHGWIEARYLRIGDYVYECGGSILLSSEILELHNLNNDIYDYVCDITVDSPYQSFICGTPRTSGDVVFRGICVHNSSMGKQAVGIPGSNYMFKTKGIFHVMNYYQKQLIHTKMSKIMGFQHQPSGLNTIIFIGPLLGLNQEDSLAMNQDSVDRGFMTSTIYLPYDAKVRKDKGEIFEIPDEEECSNFHGNISKLGEDGIVREGECIAEGDILIGKTVCVDEDSSIYHKTKKNLSVKYDHELPGIVHLVQHGIDGQGYYYVRVVIAQERLPIEGDKFCFTPDHDILTDQGWINITEITPIHKVATLNHSQEIEYHHPTATQMFEHTGEMIEIDTNQISLCVTLNHKLYVKKGTSKEYGLVEAGDVYNKMVKYKKNGININKGSDYFILPSYIHYKKRGDDIVFLKKKLPMKEWLIFYGIWIAEGYVSSGKNVVCVHKQRVKVALEKVLPILGFDYNIYSNGVTLSILNIHLRKYMEPFSLGAINKKLEDWVWDLNEEHSRVLLESLCLGDGHINGATPMYDTSSEQLKDDIMRLALNCGWSANAYVKLTNGTRKIIHGKDTITNADAWRITIVKTQNEPAINKHIKNQDKIIQYSGKVYCCTVPNHVMYVRRTTREDKFVKSKKVDEEDHHVSFSKRIQKACWSGNSASHGQKGSVGYLARSHELPFNKYGITPDIMVNPLALPSRMTIGMMIEMLCGKLVCSTSKLHRITVDQVFKLDDPSHPNPKDDVSQDDTSSKEKDDDTEADYRKFISVYDEEIDEEMDFGQDATPWVKGFSVKNICAELKKLGLNEFSSERMTYGKTGRVQEYLTYEGICYYQRLKHMVIDKHHSRSRGAKVRLTRQPLDCTLQAGLRL